MNGRLVVLKELLDRGADINAKDNNGWNTLQYAYNLDIVTELVKRGAIIDLVTLLLYPEITIDQVHVQVGMADKWESVMLLILQERKNYEKEDFNKYLLRFLVTVKAAIPENISIVLNSLI